MKKALQKRSGPPLGGPYPEKGIFCIINLAGLAPAEILDPVPIDCGYLKPERRPRAFYDNMPQAEAELFRLSKKFPDGDFHIFGSIFSIRSSLTVPGASHIEPDRGEDHIPF